MEQRGREADIAEIRWTENGGGGAQTGGSRGIARSGGGQVSCAFKTALAFLAS